VGLDVTVVDDLQEGWVFGSEAFGDRHGFLGGYFGLEKKRNGGDDLV
jgi:hypothetical protein